MRLPYIALKHDSGSDEVRHTPSHMQPHSHAAREELDDAGRQSQPVLLSMHVHVCSPVPNRLAVDVVPTRPIRPPPPRFVLPHTPYARSPVRSSTKAKFFSRLMYTLTTALPIRKGKRSGRRIRRCSSRTKRAGLDDDRPAISVQQASVGSPPEPCGCGPALTHIKFGDR